MQEATTQILLYRLLFPVIAPPPIAQMAQCVIKGSGFTGCVCYVGNIEGGSRSLI
ncbi:hypothetical protein SB58_003044 [Salmonella enterica subsp. enterica]|nr:hypothetical protein [Salmonella enterica subsp. enterica]